MPTEIQFPSLQALDFIAYLDPTGAVPAEFSGKVGVYAIFDAAYQLQYVGYSRDITTSLVQHLVRRSSQCHFFKAFTVTKPSRTVLEAARTAWIEEYGEIPSGNGAQEAQWTQPIDAKQQMTEEERMAIESAEEKDQAKLLKQLARRIEAEVLETLQTRGVTLPLRFNPKLKERGLLDLK